MKIMAIADTHNDTYYTQLALDVFTEESYDKLFVLGDIGLRTISLLNPYHARILAVKGNCDGEEEEAKARFQLPLITFDYDFGRMIVLTHGHFYTPYDYDQDYQIFLSGHSHLSGIYQKEDGKIIANPGSLASPRDYNHSYLALDETGLKVKDVETGEVVHFLDYRKG
ncbi:MAG: YfcE family phosphodiesterase [Bacilli bacterium]|jgi:putative phosphoesterase|nr:YfcE family phosphodiesterase [Bacilli bacterium]